MQRESTAFMAMLNSNPRLIYTPSFDLRTVFPFLEPISRTAVLLRPVRATVPDPFASKLGGRIAWPQSEQWPRCDHHACPYVPILQLRRDDFPELPFPPSADLLQILWCPEDMHPEAVVSWSHHATELFDGSMTLLLPLPTFRWRNASQLSSQRLLEEIPKPTMVLVEPHMPNECSLNPVRVTEFPQSEELITSTQVQQVENWVRVIARHDFEAMNLDPDNDVSATFAKQFSVAPGSKIGGFEDFSQYPPSTKCPNCEAKMSHLLTISTAEYGENDAKRWHPYDQNGSALPLDYRECSGICIGDLDKYFAHVCLRCEYRPIFFQSSTQ